MHGPLPVSSHYAAEPAKSTNVLHFLSYLLHSENTVVTLNVVTNSTHSAMFAPIGCFRNYITKVAILMRT
jgi:hypothetical protein